jgi:chromosomal replication initiator protein
MPHGVEHYTFARWVSTPENRSALAAVQRVVDCVCGQRLRREVNPLFLHGPSGSGKTHLVSALAGEVIRRRPDGTCSLVAAGECAALLRPAEEAPAPLTREPAAEWDSDLLVIEDVQHLPARAAEGLAQVHDARCARQQQTVYTASAGPAQLVHLPARLTSRWASGLVVGLGPLAPTSRFAFLQDRAQRRQLPVGRDVLLWLADHCGGSARQLEGALARVETLVRLNDRLPDLPTVAAHFRIESDAARPTVERIAERVGRYFQVEPRQMQSRRRLRHALLPRQVGMYLARQLTPLSLEQIGAYFGGRDHSTVLHACRKVEQAMARDAALSGAVQRLHADLA